MRVCSVEGGRGAKGRLARVDGEHALGRGGGGVPEFKRREGCPRGVGGQRLKKGRGSVGTGWLGGAGAGCCRGCAGPLDDCLVRELRSCARAVESVLEGRSVARAGRVRLTAACSLEPAPAASPVWQLPWDASATLPGCPMLQMLQLFIF